jgi:flagella basal body P-ring formation protein FlgA
MKAIVLACALVAGLGGGGDEDGKGRPQTSVRLKPAAAVRGLDITIGELCECSGDATGAAIAAVRFGDAPVHGYARTVSRTEIVQALAGAGVDVTTLKVDGADEVLVQAIVVDVPGAELLEAATAALQAVLAVEGGDVEYEAPSRVRQVQAPPGRRSQELQARVRGGKTSSNAAVVDVEIVVDGQGCKKVPVTFRLQRFRPVLKTLGTVRAGMPLGPDVLAVSREQVDQLSGLFLDRMDQVEGLIAARDLQPGRRLTLGDTAPPSVVHKGEVVTVVLTRGRVKVTAKAMANHDAPLAGRVTLTNLQSRGTLTGVVQGPGLVVVQQ